MACKPVEKPSVLRDIRTFVKWTLIASGVGTLLFLLLSMNGGQ
jgi:xanthine/uracil permease